MSRLPVLTGQAVIQALKREGFEDIRQKGSHRILRHPDGRSTVVPVHAGEDVGPGLLSKILRDTRLTREEFFKLLTPRPR